MRVANAGISLRQGVPASLPSPSHIAWCDEDTNTYGVYVRSGV
ncbi:uncharacterized protein RAG0_07904 [Rhynchosporium agropyri]|uniref:Uncharacterized protein n=2 Tax=Rhynchosporium TaxID=38037 RepID=A0A1E1KND9_9HELO|nr:uncharacterized protein RAG0_07904 [Rhynchosporium agropyri]CZT07429.1 uncharacterized protein RCO7_09726 [Rhynchosporium commune]